MKKATSNITVCSFSMLDNIEGNYNIEVVAKNENRVATFYAIAGTPFECLREIEIQIIFEFEEYFSFSELNKPIIFSLN